MQSLCENKAVRGLLRALQRYWGLIYMHMQTCRTCRYGSVQSDLPYDVLAETTGGTT